MSAITTILRKDLRQFRVLIGLLLGLLAVLVAVCLEWTGSVMPEPGANGLGRLGFGLGLQGMLWMVIVILTGKLSFNVVFSDSPGRPERFLATRPVATREVLLAKLLFLAAFVAGPFALAAIVYLLLSGMPARVVFLGTAESLVRSGVVIGLAVPLVLLWETYQRFITGLVAAGIGIGLFSLGIGLLYGSSAAMPPFRPDLFADPLVQVTAAAMGAIMLGTLAAVHLRRSLRLSTRLATLALAGLVVPLLAGLAFSYRPTPPTDEVSPCEMVLLGFNATYSGDQSVLGISLAPSTPTPLDEDTNWSFDALRLGEHRLPLRPRPDPRSRASAYLHSQFSRGIEAALRGHLGADWAVVSRHAGRDLSPGSASAFARPPRIPDGAAPVEALLRGDRFSWHCVAELPFIPGSSVRDGDATWTFGRFARDESNRLTFSFRHIGPELWLATRGRSRSFNDRGHVFAVVDPLRQLVTVLGDRYPATTLGRGTACPRRGFKLHLDGGREMDDFVTADPSTLRLLVLRPRYEGTRFARWTSPSPVDLPTPRRDSSGSGLANEVQDLEPANITRWIEENPPPPASASDAEIVPYLVALFERTNRCGKSLTEHPAVEMLAAYVPGHLDLLLRALDALQMDHHVSERLLFEAIEAGLEPRQLPDIVGRLREHPLLLRAIVERGWAAEVTPDLVRLVLNGDLNRRMLEVLTSEAGAPGLSRDEWLAVFRLEFNRQTYRFLRQVPELEPGLNAMIDARIATHIPVLDTRSLDPLLELALERGHADGPVLLHRAIRYSVSFDYHIAFSLSHHITLHFELTGYTGQHHDDEAIVAWFLDQDPADFSYDPDSRKYQLKPAP